MVYTADVYAALVNAATSIKGFVGGGNNPVGSVNQWLTLLDSLYPLGTAPSGDTWGHYLFGWDTNDLATHPVSLTYFWNNLDPSLFGWSIGNAPTVSQSASVTNATGNSSATSTTNGTTGANASNTNVGTAITNSSGVATSGGATQGDLIFGGIDFSAQPIPFVPIPLWALIGVGVVALFMLDSGGKHHRGE